MKLWFKIRKNLEFYETLLAELQLEEEYNYKILLRMTSEDSEEIYQLIKDDIPEENIKLRELNPPRLQPTIITAVAACSCIILLELLKAE